jgi:histidine triad (HIT) family protein
MSESSKSVKEDIENMSPEELAEYQKKNCIFCKIANKEIPAKIIHEDSEIIAILDINPASEGHILVYPKKHYMILPHIPEELLSKLFSNVKYVSNVLLKSMQSGGTTIFVANGSAAGQRAPHGLIHVFPRRENDGLLKLPKYEMNDETLEKLKENLSKYFSHVLENQKNNSNNLIPDNESKKQKENVENHKEKKKNVKESEDTKEKKKDSKISLDDIGKLFG